MTTIKFLDNMNQKMEILNFFGWFCYFLNRGMSYDIDKL